MMSLLQSGQSIPERVWLRGANEQLSTPPNVPAGADEADGQAVQTGDWETMLSALDQLRELGDNWDGLGAPGPGDELVDSAVGLARVFQQNGQEPPTRVAASPEGTVLLEWQSDNGVYAEVEVVRPFYAEVMLLEPGKPAQHWTLPSEA